MVLKWNRSTSLAKTSFVKIRDPIFFVFFEQGFRVRLYGLKRLFWLQI